MSAEKGNKYAVGNKGGGRKEEYNEEYVELAYKFCLLGATDKQLAEMFDVSEQTVNIWKNKHEEFNLALKRGKTQADANVAQRLYSRALGYVAPETKIVSYEGAITDKMDIEKHYPPDPTAAIFWLKNRQPEKWRDKVEIDNNVSGNIEVTFSDPNLVEWAK